MPLSELVRVKENHALNSRMLFKIFLFALSENKQIFFSSSLFSSIKRWLNWADPPIINLLHEFNSCCRTSFFLQTLLSIQGKFKVIHFWIIKWFFWWVSCVENYCPYKESNGSGWRVILKAQSWLWKEEILYDFHSPWLGLIQQYTCCIIGLHLALCFHTDKRNRGNPMSPHLLCYVCSLISICPPSMWYDRESIIQSPWH